MKAITLWNPWAMLMAYGYKRFETRSWRTDYRGPIAIHAAKRWDDDIANWCLREPFATCLKEIGVRCGLDLNLGYILAIGELVGCYSTTDLQPHHKWFADHAAEHEREFGNYQAGRYAWKIANIQRLKEPIYARGKQGLWNWEPPESIRVVSSEAATAGGNLTGR